MPYLKNDIDVFEEYIIRNYDIKPIRLVYSDTRCGNLIVNEPKGEFKALIIYQPVHEYFDLTEHLSRNHWYLINDKSLDKVLEKINYYFKLK